MSDTKQQCPTCSSEDKSVRYVTAYCTDPTWNDTCPDPWHDSPVEGSAPLAAGSGAREQFKVWIAKNGYNPNKQANVRWKDIAGWCEYFIREVWEPQYADHCTAQLREQLDRAIADYVREVQEWKKELALRETAEAELATVREALSFAQETIVFFSCVIKSGESWSDQCEERKRAALRGKGE